MGAIEIKIFLRFFSGFVGIFGKVCDDDLWVY